MWATCLIEARQINGIFGTVRLSYSIVIRTCKTTIHVHVIFR